MRIRFHGPLNRVTGSCYELYDPSLDVRFLVDCGMRQGEPNAREVNHAPFPFNPSELKFVVLTHAHIDHSGLIPRLYKEGFTGTVYCTRETAELATIALRDAARREDTPYATKHVKRIKWHEPGNAQAVVGRHAPVSKDVFLQFFRTGHLLGATAVTVSVGPIPRRGEPNRQIRITFSGDLGPNTESNEHQLLLRSAMRPPKADYCVIESTYGGVLRSPEHQWAEARLKRLGSEIAAGLDRGGLVILPCFAMGRTQEVLLDLHLLHHRDSGLFRGAPIYFDGPMAHRVNRIYARGLGRTFRAPKSGEMKPVWLSRSIFGALGLDRSNPAHHEQAIDCLKEMLDPEQRRGRNRLPQLSGWRRLHEFVEPSDRSTVQGPAVLVTGGGMCDGGPVQSYLSRGLPLHTTTVLMTGYAGPATVAGRLLQLRELDGAQRRVLAGRVGLELDDLALRDVQARIACISGYSAHADEVGLLEWLFTAGRPNDLGPAGGTVFITHGDSSRREALAASIRVRAEREGHDVRVELPADLHGWFDLRVGGWDDSDRTAEELLRAENDDLRRRLAALQRSLGGGLG